MHKGYAMITLALIVASVLSGCAAAGNTQPEPELLVHPNVGEPLPELLISDLVRFETEDTPDGVVFDLDASIVLEGTISLVDSGLTWEIVESEATGAWIDPQGRLTMPNDGVVWVRANVGPLHSDKIKVRLDRSVPQAAPRPVLRQPPGDVPTREATKAAVEAARARLRALGFPSAMTGTVDSTVFAANGTTYTYISGYGDMLPDGVDAIYMESGLGTVNGNTYVYPSPIIVLTDDMAQLLVDGGMFDANGRLTDAGRLVLHELVHAVNDQLGIDAPEVLDELVAHAMETEQAQRQVEIVGLIQEGIANGELTAEQKNRLKMLITSFNTTVTRIESDAEDNDDVSQEDREKLESLLGLFEWRDVDEDGFPDWLDAILDLIFPNGLPDWLIFVDEQPAEFPGGPAEAETLP